MQHICQMDDLEYQFSHIINKPKPSPTQHHKINNLLLSGNSPISLC